MSPSSSSCVLALDAGGTSIKYGLVPSPPTALLDFGEIPIRSSGSAAEIGEDFTAAARACRERARERGLLPLGLGVSVPGPFDYASGASLMTHKWPAARLMPLRPFLESGAGPLGARFVSDSSAFLLGELAGGDYVAYRSPCAAIVGTGLGFAAMREGKLLLDERGAPAIKIFQAPCRDGIAEDFVSKRGISRIYAASGGRREAAVKEIAEAARLGERPAIAAFELAGRALAEVLAPVILSGGFDCLVIGGQIGKAGPLLASPAASRLAELGVARPVLTARRIDEAPLLGAARAFAEGGVGG